jgi:hypothetical protein
MDEWSGSLITPGDGKDQSAYQSELAGIFGIVVMIFSIQEFFGVSNYTLEIGCDGQSALSIVQVEEDFISPQSAEYDLIYSIWAILAKLTGVVTWRHIKGHQDELDVELNYWALQNIEMDHCAKQKWDNILVSVLMYSMRFGLNHGQCGSIIQRLLLT